MFFCLFVKMSASYGDSEDRMRKWSADLCSCRWRSESLASPSVPPETLERGGEGSELKLA